MTQNTQESCALASAPQEPPAENKRGRGAKPKKNYTMMDSFLKLCAIQETALALEPKPDFTAALRSEELKGKLYGLYADKKGVDEALLPCLLVEFVDKEDLNGEGADG